MDINLDLCFVPDQLISLITNSIEIEPFLVKNCYTNIQSSNTTTIYKLEFPGTIKEFEDLLKTVLKKNSIEEYIVVQDMEKENTFTILRDGDMGQLGILICDLCGALFNSEDEKYIHQRAHFLF
jgi:hypothetical protein